MTTAAPMTALTPAQQAVIRTYRTERRFNYPLPAAAETRKVTAVWVASTVAEGRAPTWELDAYRMATDWYDRVAERSGASAPCERYWLSGRVSR